MTAREPSVDWRKSSYSGDQACVEVAAAPGGVLVRDSKNPDGPTLAVTTAAWRDFLAEITPDPHEQVSKG